MPPIIESTVAATLFGVYLGVLLGRRGGNVPGFWHLCAIYLTHRALHWGRRQPIACLYCRESQTGTSTRPVQSER